MKRNFNNNKDKLIFPVASSDTYGFKKNNAMNYRQSEEDSGIVENNTENNLIEQEPLNEIAEPQNEDLDSNDNKEDNSASAEIKEGFKKFIIANPWIIFVAGGIGILFLLLFSVFSGGASSGDTGYMDSACNFNEAVVTVTNCYNDINDKKEITTITLSDYVIGATYAYTKGNDYSLEAIKAFMIAIKTNALSYGGYNSSNKELELKSCSLNNYYCNPDSGCSIINEGFNNDLLTYMEYDEANSNNIEAASAEYKKKLTSIYNEISNYIFVSSSYHSAISNLSSANALNINENTLDYFEGLAESYDYKSILDTSFNALDESDNTSVYKDTLFIGDSRTYGMILAGLLSKNNTVYGSGYGYDWFIGDGNFDSNNTNAQEGAINGISSKMRNNANYNIVIWLGVNDYSSNNASTYFSKYVELATSKWSNHTIYIVSVSPVDDAVAKNVSNAEINNFNTELQNLVNNANLENLKYIDLNLSSSDINRFDSEGLHYSNADYEKIYNIITSNIDNTISNKLTLYNLTDYCIYYGLTENTAYWWPIGSREATNGKIYGGSPVSVNITSTFGPRRDPITGVLNSGHGAIDIGTPLNTPVIATKNGTVTKVITGCMVGDLDCGGKYGNHVIIDHGDGIKSLYAHLSDITVNVGDTVSQGELIAFSGNTGRSTGPHLHFEIRLNEVRVDPLNYVDKDNPRPVKTYKLGSVDDSGVTAKENKSLICRSLMDSGFSKNAVAGMLANIYHEGGFLTNNLENCYEENRCCTSSTGKKYGYCMHPELKGFGSDSLYTEGINSGRYPKDLFIKDRAGYGLIQWTSENRKLGLYNYAKSENKSISALSVQLGYLLEELEGYEVTMKYVTGSYDASTIAENFCLDFERPDNKTVVCQNRGVEANEFLEYVTNGCKED